MYEGATSEEIPDSVSDLALEYTPSFQETRIIHRVLSDFAAFKSALDPKREKFIDFYEHYYNKRQIKKPPGYANVPVPLATETVDTVWADIMAKLFGPDGVRIDVMGREQMDQDHAKAVRDLIRYQTYEDGFEDKFGGGLHTCLVCGTMPFKVCYIERYEVLPTPEQITDPITGVVVTTRTVPREQLVYKGPTLIPIDILDFFPHPQMVHIHDDLPVIHRFYATKNELEEMARPPGALYKNIRYIDWEREGHLSEPEIDPKKKERRAMAGIKDTQLEKHSIECYEWQGMFDLEGNGERKNCVLTVTQDGIVLRGQELPYYDQKKTYELMKIFPVEGELWGIGLIEKQHAMIHGCNSLINAMLDSLYQNVNPPTLIRENAFLDESELVNRSGQFVHVDPSIGQNLSTDFMHRMPPQMIVQDAWSLFGMFQDFAQSATSAKQPMTGDMPGRKQTATAVSTAFGQSQVRFKAILSMIENSGLLPICSRQQRINQQFIDSDYAMRVIGTTGAYWRTISPADIAGQVNFISLGSTHEADKAINIQQLLQAINIAGGTPMLQNVVPILFVAFAEEADLPQIELMKQLLQWDQQRQNLLQQLQMQAAQIQAQQGAIPQLPDVEAAVQPQSMMQPENRQDLLNAVHQATMVRPGEGIPT